MEPKDPEVFTVGVDILIKPILFHEVYLQSKGWFSPTTALALQRVRMRKGFKDFKKTYRFTDRGVFRQRREPKNSQEASLIPERWTEFRKDFYPYDDMDQFACRTIMEPSTILYVLATAEIKESGNPLNLCVFDKKRLYLVVIKPGASERRQVVYLEKSAQGERQKMETVEVVPLALKSEPLSKNGKQDKFSFLGFEGDIDILLEKSARFPVEIIGHIPAVGTVNFKLRQMRMGNNLLLEKERKTAKGIDCQSEQLVSKKRLDSDPGP